MFVIQRKDFGKINPRQLPLNTEKVPGLRRQLIPLCHMEAFEPGVSDNGKALELPAKHHIAVERSRGAVVRFPVPERAQLFHRVFAHFGDTRYRRVFEGGEKRLEIEDKSIELSVRNCGRIDDVGLIFRHDFSVASGEQDRKEVVVGG